MELLMKIVVFVLMFFARGYAVMYLWNSALVETFHLPVLTFGTALALIALVDIILPSDQQ